MKIDRDKKEWAKYTTIGGKTSREVQRRPAASFEQELAQHHQSQGHIKMQEILNQLDQVSERLKRSLNLTDLMLYKRLVKDFLREAASQAYLVKQEHGRSRRGRALLVTIQTVDKEIEQMLDEFTRRTPEPLEVLETLDKIRGILVDLMV
ncbi:MAG TPA: YaaR family protein [Syntrophomonadaceae bacterium]|nr:YaaR family protein [Syntrophomonadaceae bacterium]HOQ10122.1 YaaR family protein [Syntrophomonadaceae bacterium]HPU49255.1 YaaR family protein [Syntrophomonadaceae bacterium]